MKKFVAVALICVMIFGLCACGSTAAPTETQSANTSSAPKETGEKKEENAPEQKAEEKAEKPENTYAGEVIVDNDICRFEITGVDPDALFGYTLKAVLENKSEYNLMFAWENTSVNGVMNDPLFATDVAAGKKATADICFMNGIKSADEIAFTLRVYDNDDWMKDPFIEEEYAIYPTGLSKESIVYEEKDLSDSFVVVDNENISFAIEETGVDSIWGYYVKVYMENKTDKNLMFAWEDVSVNGFMSDPFWATEVAAGKKNTSDVYFFNLEEDGVTGDVSEIEFKLRVYDSDDWMASPIIENVYVYNP